MSDYEIAERLMDEISDRLETDAVLPLVLSVNDEKIERHWVLPKAKMVSKFIASTKADLESYARIAVGADRASAKTAISEAMNEIRILHKFDPTLHILRPAYDAAQGMNIRVRKLPLEKGLTSSTVIKGILLT